MENSNENLVKIEQTERLSLPQVKLLLVADINDLKLNNREKVFIAVYCHNNFNKYAAYLSAGYKGTKRSVIQDAADRLLSRDSVQEAIRRITGEMVKPFLPLMELNIFKVQYIRAFYDISDFFHDDGTIKPLPEIPAESRFAIDGIGVRYYGKDCQKEVKEYKLADRSEALREIQALVTKYRGNGATNATPEELTKLREMIFNKNYDSLPGKVIGIEKGR